MVKNIEEILALLPKATVLAAPQQKKLQISP